MSIAEIFAAEKIKIPKHISTTITESHNKSIKSTRTNDEYSICFNEWA